MSLSVCRELLPVDIIFYEAFAEEIEALRRYLPLDIHASFTPDTIQENLEHEPPAPIISIRTQSLIPRDWVSKISGILTRSTGFDHVTSFLNGCVNPVPAGYLPQYCSRSVAEQAMLLWMSLLRKLPRQMHNFPSFNRDGLTGGECAGKVLLVAGVGNIGYEVYRIGQALGMDALGVDIVHRHTDVRYVTIDEGLGRADIIVCSMNLTQDNRGYFDYRRLKQSKPGILFINIARGELSPTHDLLRLVNEKHLAGIGLDVYENESTLAACLRSGSNPDTSELVATTLELSSRDEVILTPHNAFNTAEALERKARQSVEQIEHFLKKGTFIWPVPYEVSGKS